MSNLLHDLIKSRIVNNSSLIDDSFQDEYP